MNTDDLVKQNKRLEERVKQLEAGPMSKLYPFKYEDVRTANYFIVSWLSWEKSRATDTLRKAMFDFVLKLWTDKCHKQKREHERQQRKERGEFA